MQQPNAFFFETDNIHKVPDAGFFTWDVPDNLLYADGALARLFGIDEVLANRACRSKIIWHASTKTT